MEQHVGLDGVMMMRMMMKMMVKVGDVVAMETE